MLKNVRETKTQKQTKQRKWNTFEIVVWKITKMRMRGYRTLIRIFLPTHFHQLSNKWRTIIWNCWCQSLISVFRIEIISETRQKNTQKHQHKHKYNNLKKKFSKISTQTKIMICSFINLNLNIKTINNNENVFFHYHHSIKRESIIWVKLKFIKWNIWLIRFVFNDSPNWNSQFNKISNTFVRFTLCNNFIN
jgi:hypothetical protein